jgi:O-antigen ligase
MLATIAHSHHKVSSVGVILRVFYLVAAWFWLAAICLRTRNQIWAALKFWVVSAAVCGVWALAQKYVHVPGGVDADRFAGLADHVNDLGSLTACALVPALALAYRAKKWTVAVVGIAVGLVLSGSIGAGIAALAALAVGLVSRELTKPTLVAIAVGAVALVLASPLIGTSAVTRFSTATSSFAPNNQDTLNTRLRTYKAAWHRIEQSPLLGSGLDLPSAQIYDPQSGNSFQVHNLFLGRLYDSGILGLAGILVLVTCLGVAGWRLVISSPDRYLSLALFAGFVAYVAADMSEPSLYKRYSLVPAFLIIAFRAVAIRLEAHRPEPVAEPAPTAGPLRGRVAPHPRPIPVPAQLGRQ